jgi:50S ribosomal protein L16 3-hydroxylase
MPQLFNSISSDTFFSEYWQKKPLLIRQAFPNFTCPVTPDELAGLACEPEVESRLVYRQLNKKKWQLEQGPFNEDKFSHLPKADWSLLVQGVDHWIPELADLLDCFRFLPNWQLDDIMASFSPPGGSVGPHFDEYDVFLLQGLGERDWKIGQTCNHSEPCVKGTPLRILDTFEEVDSWVLQPGDMLYLPARVAHFGTAMTDGITLSIGFRAPSHEEILEDVSRHILDTMVENKHLQMRSQSLQRHPGEIQPDVIAELGNIIRQHLNDDNITQWFGCFSTQPKNPEIVSAPEDEISTDDLLALCDESEWLVWNEGSRFCYTTPNNDLMTLFVDGEAYALSKSQLSFVQRLSEKRRMAIDELATFARHGDIDDLLAKLINTGSLYFE